MFYGAKYYYSLEKLQKETFTEFRIMMSSGIATKLWNLI